MNDTDTYNIILCDPPWGGADYKGEDKKAFGEYRYQLFEFLQGRVKDKPKCPAETIALNLDGKHILDFIKNRKYDVFVYKMPLNCDMSPFS